MQNTFNKISVKSFQRILLKNGFKVGGCVDCPDEYAGEEGMVRDIFFYKGSAIVRTSEFLSEEKNSDNTRSCFSGYLTFSTYNLPYDTLENIGGSYELIKDINGARYHSVDIRGGLFGCVREALTPKYLLPKSRIKNSPAGVRVLNNLVTYRQGDYSKIIRERLGGSSRWVLGSNKIDSLSYGCCTLAKLIALKENMECFTPEFRDTLSEIAVVLDELIKEKMDNHSSQGFLLKRAMPVITELIKEDKKKMLWYNTENIEKEIRKSHLKDIFSGLSKKKN